MEKVNNTVKIYAQLITLVLIWVVVLLIAGSLDPFDLVVALKRLPTAITLYVAVAFLFTRWIWKWKALDGWLIKLPNLNGTWRGELKSDWIDTTGNKVGAIPVVLVIRQSYLTIKATLMTAESTSYSTTADVNYFPGSEDLFLSYNYTNRPKATIRDRSEIHDGAAILKIIREPKSLEGEYWTSRKTRGEMSLQFESKKRIEKF